MLWEAGEVIVNRGENWASTLNEELLFLLERASEFLPLCCTSERAPRQRPTLTPSFTKMVPSRLGFFFFFNRS